MADARERFIQGMDEVMAEPADHPDHCAGDYIARFLLMTTLCIDCVLLDLLP